MDCQDKQKKGKQTEPIRSAAEPGIKMTIVKLLWTSTVPGYDSWSP